MKTPKLFMVVTVICNSFLYLQPAETRTLHWDELNVNATLTENGTLQIREEQSIVFNGDWNGGERIFNVRSGQRFTFTGLYRKTEKGDLVPLQRGNLGKVDHWDWASGNIVRWRSRLPGDPVFNDTKIIYILEYELGRILIPQQDGGFVLDHDFAFAKRAGDIRNFQLTLKLSGEWQQSDLQNAFGPKSLPPGESFVVTAKLRHIDPAKVEAYKKPSVPLRSGVAAVPPAPGWLAFGAAGILTGFLIFSSLRFYARERRLLRFTPGVSLEDIDEQWLQLHVFSMLPETVGATWDKATSGHEVAAVLARLVVEKKMESSVEQVRIPLLGWKIPGAYNLHLSLKQARSEFQGYEKNLVDGFFIDGDTTDTKKIRDYYREKKKTFDPVQKLREPLRKRVKSLTSPLQHGGRYGWLYIVVLFLIAFFLLLAQAFIHKTELVFTFTGGFGGIIAMVVGGNNGYIYKCRSDNLIGRSVLVHLFPILTILLFVGISFFGITSLLLTGLFFLYLAAIVTAFYFARSTDSPEGIALCRDLLSARNYFRHQLKNKAPALRNEWFPYLLAFGLGSDVDKWAKRFIGTGRFHSSHRSGSSSSLSSGSSQVFTGGGGAFGGAGASGSWAAAAGSLGVSPSSSSGGTSGGGGSSGGGGGGGW